MAAAQDTNAYSKTRIEHKIKKTVGPDTRVDAFHTSWHCFVIGLKGAIQFSIII